jgi:hypothetical protein
MIVVVLIGSVYALVLTGFNKKNIEIKRLENIKDTLLPMWKKGVRVEMVVYNRCSQSAIFINNELQEDVKSSLKSKLFKDITIYKIDSTNDTTKVKLSPIILDKKLYEVCFKFTLFPNGSSSSYIVKQGKRFYIFYPYFQYPKIFDSLEEAIEEYQLKKYMEITPHEAN